jgi:DnaK suppressor protein
MWLARQFSAATDWQEVGLMSAQLSSAQEDQVRNLQALREHTVQEIERLERELQETIEPASATDDDSADVAADVYERGKIISLVQNLQAKLHAIDHAIEAAMRGRYGICEKCGAIIPEERLEIMPETTMCVKCVSELEQGIRRHQLLLRSRMRSAEARPRAYGVDDEEDNPLDVHDD